MDDEPPNGNKPRSSTSFRLSNSKNMSTIENKIGTLDKLINDTNSNNLSFQIKKSESLFDTNHEISPIFYVNIFVVVYAATFGLLMALKPRYVTQKEKPENYSTKKVATFSLLYSSIIFTMILLWFYFGNDIMVWTRK